MSNESYRLEIQALLQQLEQPRASIELEEARALLCGSGHALMIYGAGRRGREVADVLQARGHRILCFMDRAAPDALVGGRPCFAPADHAAQALCEENRATVVVAVYNSGADPQEIDEQLSALGYGRRVSFLDFHAVLGKELGESYWLGAASTYSEQESSILDAAELWEDARSRAIYHEMLRFRLSRDIGLLRTPTLDEQYFPLDVSGWPSDAGTALRFVDGGAFVGDTLADLLRREMRVQAVAAFEPEAQNFARLSAFVAAHESEFSDAQLWPCGLWQESGSLRFAGGDGPGSRLEADGAEQVPVVALDDVLLDFEPTLVKLDIEGAEIEALRGARAVIAAARPALAICLYHRAEHLWQVPLLIANWDLGYRFYLRYHGFNGLETVLYAVAEGA